jgi:hypothetical protein
VTIIVVAKLSLSSSSTWGWVSLNSIYSSHPHPPTHPPTPGKVYLDDGLNFFEKGRQPQFFWMEDDLNLFQNERRPQFQGKWKTTSICKVNRRRPQLFDKWEMNTVSSQPKLLLSLALLSPSLFDITNMHIIWKDINSVYGSMHEQIPVVKMFEEYLNKRENRKLENKVEPPCDPSDPLSCIVAILKISSESSHLISPLRLSYIWDCLHFKFSQYLAWSPQPKFRIRIRYP